MVSDEAPREGGGQAEANDSEDRTEGSSEAAASGSDAASDRSEMPESQSSPVPSGRLSRFLQLSSTAGRMAAGGAKERLRRMARRAEAELPHALLTVENAKLLAARLARLRGAAMKVGQMLSLEGDHMLPKEFAQALDVLRSSAHHMPERQVREVLQAEYGRDWPERFKSFEFEPIASASIGQVHRAETHEGESIVLKIQYPGVAESIDSDVDNLRSLLALTRLVPTELDLDELTEEVKKELREEVDYTRELDKLVAYAEGLGDRSPYRMPRAFPAHSTRRILAMELVRGRPVLDWARTASQEDRDRVAAELLELLLLELFDFRLMQTDPNPANYFYDEEESRLVLLDFGATRAVSDEVSELYRRAFEGIAHGDREQLRQVVHDLGVHSDEAPEATELLIDIGLSSSEAFGRGLYDFAASDLQGRLKERGLKLAAYRKHLKAPPPEYMFFQRKLGGTYLLCRQLRARVDCRAVLERSGVLR